MPTAFAETFARSYNKRCSRVPFATVGRLVCLATPCRLDDCQGGAAGILRNATRTRFTLRETVAGAIREVGLDRALAAASPGRARTITWFAGARGVGIRHYQSGRKVYVVQTGMRGGRAP